MWLWSAGCYWPEHWILRCAEKRREEFFHGFSGYGFQPSPALGKVISELIVDGKTGTNDISSLLIERFKTGQGVLEPLTAFKK